MRPRHCERAPPKLRADRVSEPHPGVRVRAERVRGGTGCTPLPWAAASPCTASNSPLAAARFFRARGLSGSCSGPTGADTARAPRASCAFRLWAVPVAHAHPRVLLFVGRQHVRSRSFPTIPERHARSRGCGGRARGRMEHALSTGDRHRRTPSEALGGSSPPQRWAAMSAITYCPAGRSTKLNLTASPVLSPAS